MRPLSRSLARRLVASSACILISVASANGQSSPPSSLIAPSNAPSAVSTAGSTVSPAAIAATPPSRARAISPATAARLTEAAPKYLPPKTEQLSSPSPRVAPDNDKPKNGIIRLPDYVVRDAPPPTFKSRELLTLTGKLDLAYQRRPGLRLGSLPFFSNNGVALALLEEDFALERAAELKELSSLAPAGLQPALTKQNTKGVDALVSKTRE